MCKACILDNNRSRHSFVSSEERNMKISIAQKGVLEKEETKKNLSDIMKQYYIDNPERKILSGTAMLGKHHTQEFKDRMSKRVSGCNNYFWKGGISKEDGYLGLFTEDIKKAVKKRDKYRCKICNIHRNNSVLAVHHINEDKMDNSFENLITLCISCHSIVHWRSKQGGDA